MGNLGKEIRKKKVRLKIKNRRRQISKKMEMIKKKKGRIQRKTINPKEIIVEV